MWLILCIFDLSLAVFVSALYYLDAVKQSLFATMEKWAVEALGCHPVYPDKREKLGQCDSSLIFSCKMCYCWSVCRSFVSVYVNNAFKLVYNKQRSHVSLVMNYLQMHHSTL